MPSPSPPFRAWLEALSLDAARTDLCPNLGYIPIAQLRRLWREGCAPGAEAIIDWKFHNKATRARASENRRSVPALAATAGASN